MPLRAPRLPRPRAVASRGGPALDGRRTQGLPVWDAVPPWCMLKASARRPLPPTRKEKPVPLLDHFRPPLSERRPWESFHATWAGALADALNQGVLPSGYIALEQVHAGAAVEI